MSEAAILKETLLELEEKESQRIEDYFRQQQVREEKQRKLEHEREEKRERKENEREEKQMAMMMQMQMAMMSAIMGVPSTSNNDPMSSLMQMQLPNNMNADNQFQDI